MKTWGKDEGGEKCKCELRSMLNVDARREKWLGFA
jgi:hypothetical protein